MRLMLSLTYEKSCYNFQVQYKGKKKMWEAHLAFAFKYYLIQNP